ncbi:MerR family transcriptional regulator [Nocardia sp. NPDC020380]|uniref:helix-turn-helix domain-containing protein n=1 Tax=Nocardia sp. NPDC020380 TaxID=3364309 RepID=UPI0037B47A71
MAWSTRQLARLAGTTVRAVRYYHEVGVLAEPERGSNGYKRYGVTHLVRVLRIKRLAELGFSLGQIIEMGDMTDHPEQALRTLDGELAAAIERLQRIRAEVSLTLNRATPTDLPPRLATAAVEVDLSDADRALGVVLSRVVGPALLDAYADLLETYFTHHAVEEFGELTADADEWTRHELAQRLARLVREMRESNSDLTDFTLGAPYGAHVATETIGLALTELYNPAQLDVLGRIADLLAADSGAGHS